MRRQFHKITSRGAYKVWATAIAVKIAPNAPRLHRLQVRPQKAKWRAECPEKNSKGSALCILRHCRKGGEPRTTATHPAAAQTSERARQPASGACECYRVAALHAVGAVERQQSGTR